MTVSQWRAIAAFCIVAAFVVLIVSVRKQTTWERDSATAVVVLDSVQRDNAKLKDQNAALDVLAKAGIRETAAHKQTIDSLWAVSNARADSLHRVHRAPVVVDIHDTVEVARMIATLTAERDLWHSTADALHVQAVTQSYEDSVRYTSIAARVDTVRVTIDSATQHVEAARKLVDRPWYKRWAASSGRVAKAGTIAAISYALGRLR